MVREFDCADCGAHVTSFGDTGVLFLMGKRRDVANEQNLCAECMYIRSIEDPIEREAVRDFLHRPKEKPV